MAEVAKKPQRQGRRYQIASPVEYRGGDGVWHEGTTVNIASSGLLFKARVAMPIASEVDLHIALTHGLASGADVLCSGKVIRSEPAPEAGETLMAVTIERFQLRRAEPRPPPETS